jgi:hypothetical protein
MLARCGFARLRPLIATAGLSAGTVALLACERPEPRPPTPLPVDPWVAVAYDGCSEVPAIARLRDHENKGQDFSGAEWPGAKLRGTTFTACNFRGGDFRGTDFTGADLWECDFTGAELTGANLSGVTYDIFTRWPAGFDPQAHGARMDIAGAVTIPARGLTP